MIRLAHLCDRDADFQTRRGIDQLATSLGPEFTVDARTLGQGNFRNLACSIVQLHRRQSPRADVLHAWGPLALLAAVLSPVQRIIYSPDVVITRRQINWLVSAMAHRSINVVCATATQHRLLIEHGVAFDRCHVIRPAVDFGRLRAARAAGGLRAHRAGRAALGFTESQKVMLAIGDSVRGAGHRLAVWTAAILNELDPRFILLLWGTGCEVAMLEQFARRLGRPNMLVNAQARLGRAVNFEELALAADIGLVTADGPATTMPIAIAMAAALPIVSTLTYTTCEILEDRHSALMAKKPVARLVARRVLDLSDDATLIKKITDTAAAEAFEFYALSRYLAQWRQCYRQAAGDMPVKIDPAASEPAARFNSASVST